MGLKKSGALAAFAIASTLFFENAAAQGCDTVTLQEDVPTNTNVSLKSYSYCAGSLNVSVYIANVNYNKLVTLYYADASGQSSPLTSLALDYTSAASNNSNTWEFWGSSNGDAYIDGVSKLLNITYQAVDIGSTYNQILNTDVQASGAPPPKEEVLAPYASPKGFSDDITDWLKATAGSQAATSKSKLFKNINIDGAAPGTIIAAQSYSEPDYAYNWVRDSSLTMELVKSLYGAAVNSTSGSSYEELLFQYSAARAQEQIDPDLQTGLGEPKFHLNNTIFTGPWGRPQNDGPATSAITLIEFADLYLAAGGSIDNVKQKIYDSTNNPSVAPVQKDLLFVASNWSSTSYDLWEEESSAHFYTRLVQRRALIMGSTFAKQMGDDNTATTLSNAQKDLEGTLAQFWNANRNLILYEYGPVLKGKSSYKDIAVVLGVIHGYAGDGLYSYTDPQVLASSYSVATSFIGIYGVSKTTKDANGGVLGIPVGRYPEDVYNGTATAPNGGNPWYLCTAAMAELFYRATIKYTTEDQSISVTSASVPFWNYFAPGYNYQDGQVFAATDEQFSTMIQSLQGWADAFIRRVKYHTPSDGSLAEEFHREEGTPRGAPDLTWSYASVLTAAIARADARNEAGYTAALAGL